MESEYLWTAILVAIAASALLHVAVGLWLQRSLVRVLGRVPSSAADFPTSPAASAEGSADRMAEVAPELVMLARMATDSAIRTEEVHEWHQLDLFPLGSDDISQAVRDKLRRALFDAVTARSALFVALRRNRAVIPAPVEAELRAFCERLEPTEEGTRAERKRRLAADLDALEHRLREYLNEDMRPTAPSNTHDRTGQ